MKRHKGLRPRLRYDNKYESQTLKTRKYFFIRTSLTLFWKRNRGEVVKGTDLINFNYTYEEHFWFIKAFIFLPEKNKIPEI